MSEQFLIPSGRVLTTGDFLEAPVGRVMSPGVICISEDGTLGQAYNALVVHRVHAVLVVGAGDGAPRGWVTASGLLAYSEKDRALVSATEAITEEPHTIKRSKTVREAIEMLSQADVTHLIVVDEPGRFPLGTISDLDLAAFLGN